MHSTWILAALIHWSLGMNHGAVGVKLTMHVVGGATMPLESLQMHYNFHGDGLIMVSWPKPKNNRNLMETPTTLSKY